MLPWVLLSAGATPELGVINSGMLDAQYVPAPPQRSIVSNFTSGNERSGNTQGNTTWDEIITLMQKQLGYEILEFVCIPVSWKRQAVLV